MKRYRLMRYIPGLALALISGIFLYSFAMAAPAPVLVEKTLWVPKGFASGPFVEKRVMSVPPGFRISVFASGIDGARFMAFSPAGDLYVSQPGSSRVTVLPDRDGDGVADKAVIFADGLESPHGLAFTKTGLVVAETGGLVILKDTDGDLRADERKRLSGDIPAGGGHWTRTVVEGPDRALYVSTGSTCNVCREEDPRRASVRRFPEGEGKGRPFAVGLRNTVGLAFHPETGELWGVDNGRDWLGDDLPPEELNRIVDGGDYGWPFCYGDRMPDPEYGTEERCRDTVPPVVEMQAHSAPLGVAFGFGLKGPEEYRKVLYVAFHGSWNRSEPTGYKVVAIPFDAGKPSAEPFDFVTGWLEKGSFLRKGRAWGRPVAPAVGPDGALYVSDDRAGAVYRVTAE